MSSLGFSYTFGYFPGFGISQLSGHTETSNINVKIYPRFYKEIIVEWSIPAAWGNCVFDIYRAETEAGPFVKLNETPLNTYYFKDVSTLDFSKFIQGWYTIVVTLPDNRKIQSPPKSWHNTRTTWVELRAKEITRREELLLRKFTGIRTLTFKRRTFGKRCTRCWNAEIEKAMEDHCPVCMGTSFEGGYFPPFDTLFQYEASPNNSIFSYQGRVEVNGLNAWTTAYPEVNTFDLVLRVPDFKLFRIEAVANTELQVATVRQMVSLVELSKDNIEYKLTEKVIPSNYLI